MPPPSQVYATDRNGIIFVLDPTTLAFVGSTWASQLFPPNPGPALFGLAYENSSNFLYMVGLPDGTGSNFYALTPTLNTTYSLTSPANPATMPANSFQPESIAVDSTHSRVFVADSTRFLTVWNTNLVAQGGVFTQATGSPYYPNNGVLRAQGVAYDVTHNRVYVACQTQAGQDQLAVYDASTAPMTQITGSPYNLTLGLSTSHTSIAYDSVNNHILLTSSLGLVVLNATTFAPIAGSPFSTGGTDPRGIALDATNGRVYVCNFGSDTLAALTASTLAPIAGSPYATGHGPKNVVYYPTKNWVYVSNFNSNPGGITVYNAAVTPLTAISGSPFEAGFSFSNLAIGP
jgi:DNA-binding beta-propeller fold protein YncE